MRERIQLDEVCAFEISCRIAIPRRRQEDQGGYPHQTGCDERVRPRFEISQHPTF